MTVKNHDIIKNKISETTRQNIIDLINIGFQDSGNFEDVRIHWAPGDKLQDPCFLSGSSAVYP